MKDITHTYTHRHTFTKDQPYNSTNSPIIQVEIILSKSTSITLTSQIHTNMAADISIIST